MHFMSHVDNIGNTQKSLQALRNAIARSIDSQIRVIEVKTCQHLTSFFVIDTVKETVTWTGDGFRLDLGGDGGAGLNSAKILFRLYNIKVDVLFQELDISSMSNVEITEDPDAQNIALQSLLQDYIMRNWQQIEVTRLTCPAEEIPDYIRT